MPFNFSSSISENTEEHFFRDRELKPGTQNGRHCVARPGDIS